MPFITKTLWSNSRAGFKKKQALLVAAITFLKRYECQKIAKIKSGNVNFICGLDLIRCGFGKTKKTLHFKLGFPEHRNSTHVRLKVLLISFVRLSFISDYWLHVSYKCPSKVSREYFHVITNVCLMTKWSHNRRNRNTQKHDVLETICPDGIVT